jgi:hypothetical protein
MKMATKTTNYGLEKPDGTDFYDVDVQNSNMDIIDKQMKANANAITQLNSDKEYKTYSTDGISIEINSQCAMFYIRKSKSLTGGNTTQTLLDLPNGITLKNEVFAPCEIIDGSWTPYGNTGYINARNGQINVRCKDSTSTSIVIAMFTVPRYFIQFS